MNPVSDVYNTAQNAITTLNEGIGQLEAGNFVQGRKYMRTVIKILLDMNQSYGDNFLIDWNANGEIICSPNIAGTSACYNYARNTRNIKKLMECDRLLSFPGKVRFVIEVLKGKSELDCI